MTATGRVVDFKEGSKSATVQYHVIQCCTVQTVSQVSTVSPGVVGDHNQMVD